MKKLWELNDSSENLSEDYRKHMEYFLYEAFGQRSLCSSGKEIVMRAPTEISISFSTISPFTSLVFGDIEKGGQVGDIPIAGQPAPRLFDSKKWQAVPQEVEYKSRMVVSTCN